MKLNGSAAYLNTGTWSTKAINEAKLFGNTIIVGDSSDKNFNYIPKIIRFLKTLITFILHQTIQSLEPNKRILKSQAQSYVI